MWMTVGVAGDGVIPGSSCMYTSFAWLFYLLFSSPNPFYSFWFAFFSLANNSMEHITLLDPLTTSMRMHVGETRRYCISVWLKDVAGKKKHNKRIRLKFLSWPSMFCSWKLELLNWWNDQQIDFWLNTYFSGFQSDKMLTPPPKSVANQNKTHFYMRKWMWVV